MSLAVKRIAIIGTGVIGNSWVSLALKHGLSVDAFDPAKGAADKSLEYVKRSLTYLDCKDIPSALEKLRFFDDLKSGPLDEADFVQENGPERLDVKLSVFHELDKRVRKDVVIASSSSGLPSSKFIDQCTNDPTRILIGHPFNPPHIIPVVEIVPHPKTSPAAIENAVQFYTSLGRRPIVLGQEVPAFVGNRLQAALVHEAYSLVTRGIVSAQDVGTFSLFRADETLTKADTIVSDAIAMRWALHGPFLTKVLGGGGGLPGFEKHLSTLGVQAQSWAKDMAEHPYTATESERRKLLEQVKHELEQLGDVDLAKQRDDGLKKLLEIKAALK